MLIVNVIVLMAVAFVMGYGLGKGKIEINRVANKKMSKEMLEVEKRQLQEAIKEMEEAVQNYNSMVGGL